MVSCWPAADGALAIAVEIPPWEINAPLNGRRRDQKFAGCAAARVIWPAIFSRVSFVGRQVCLCDITQTRQMSSAGFLFILLIDSNR
jgi:hypothetical protein